MNLQRLFSPRSIALIGASRNRSKLSNRIHRNLQDGGFRGKIYLVNPNTASIRGDKVYPTVQAITSTVDCAIIVTPATTVPDVLIECGKKKIKNVIVISAGFKESGAKGVEREEQLVAIAKKYSIHLLGPNCLGIIIPSAHLNASFAQDVGESGGVTLISQSGAMAVALTDWAREHNIGFRAVVSMGNKATIGENELLQHFAKDKDTKVLVLYLEDITFGERFLEIARSVTKKKPIIVLKAGESELGKKAVQSHTGAIAGEREVLAAALQSAGVIQVDRIEDAYDCAQAFLFAPPPKGDGVALLTNAGGPGIMATDTLATTTLALAKLQPKTKQAIQHEVSSAASLHNPIDILGDATPLRYARVLEHTLKDSAVHGVVVIVTPQVMTDAMTIAKAVVRLRSRFPNKPIMTSFLGGTSVHDARAYLAQHHVPQFSYPEDAVQALARMWEYQKIKTASITQPAAHNVVGSALTKDASVLVPPTAHALLKKYGVRVIKESLVKSEGRAITLARTYTYPVVLKVSSRKLLHKTERQAVWTDLHTPQEVRTAFRAARRLLPKNPADDEGVLIQRQLTGRVELLVGGIRDQSFGPYLVVGIGGTDVELLNVKEFIFPPFTKATILKQLNASSLYQWLTKRRGATLVDPSSLAEVLANVGRMLSDHDTIMEFDINPLLAKEQQLTAVDTRILFRHK